MQNLVHLLKKSYFIKKDFSTKEAFFNYTSQFLLNEQVVNTKFYEKIIRRENEFPTGLVTPTIQVAIPHTEFECVEQDAIVICSFPNGLSFHRMDVPEELLNVSVAFMLLIKDKSNHINFLMDLMRLLQSDRLEKFKEANTLEQCIQIIKEIES